MNVLFATRISRIQSGQLYRILDLTWPAYRLNQAPLAARQAQSGKNEVLKVMWSHSLEYYEIFSHQDPIFKHYMSPPGQSLPSPQKINRCTLSPSWQGRIIIGIWCYNRNALEMIFTIKMHWKWFFFTIKMHWK